MKSVRFVGSFAVFVLAIALIVLVAAQSNPVAHANQSNVLPDLQRLAAGAATKLVPSAQKPPVSFRKAVTYSYAGQAISAAVADVNEDGKPDLVVADGDSNFVSVLLGNGDGTFQPDGAYESGGAGADSVAVGDVNGDGHPDLIVANFCLNGCLGSGPGGVSVLLGNGDGTFQPAVSYSSGGYDAVSVAIADLNGDGKLDLVVGNLDAPSLSVLLGNGDGTFQAPISYSSGGYGSVSVAIADVNGDGKPDLVATTVCQNYQGCVSVLLGNGDGTFQTAVSYSSGGYSPASVAVGDVNGDGHLDLAVANYGLDYGSDPGSVSVLLGNGNGTFQAPINYSSGGYGSDSIAIGDVNGDGKPDLVVASRCETLNRRSGTCVGSLGEVSVLLGNGDGTFQAPAMYNSGGSNYYFYYDASVAIRDLNGDGRADLVVANSGSNVGVLLNDFTATTTTKVASSLNPSQVNQSVTFAATLSSSSSVPNGSQITFYNGTAKIGTGTTTNGVAALTTTFSTAGKYKIKASYPGDAFHKGSSGSVKQVVNR